MRVIVFGATGVVGRAAAEHFAGIDDCDVIAVSRRPVDIEGVRHLPLDLSDTSAARRALAGDEFLQEDVLRNLADEADWSWTILRPQVVFGQSFGSPMNLLPAIGVYAAIENERGNALSFPGGPRGVHEAVDARLLARALEWAAASPQASGEIFNVTNGDVFGWHDVWPTIASTFGMEVGEPRPQRLADVMPPRAAEWGRLVDRYSLRAPRDMAAFVGGSWAYADILFGTLGGRPLPALLSTIKIRQAGFADCIDTEDMFREWFARLQHARLLPPV